MPRHVITQQDITQALADGRTELTLRPNRIVTALAAEVAQQTGIRLVRACEETHGAAPAEAAGQPVFGRTDVRNAVIARYGGEPDGLDRVLDRVLGR